MSKPINDGDLDLIEKSIGVRRRELEDDARAIARVRRMLEEAKGGAVQTHLPLEKEVRSDVGFNDSVRFVARNFMNEEFTVPEVEAVLKKHGVKLPGKYTRSRISTVLKDMCEKKVLVVVRPGQGKRPHVYRNA